MPNTSVNGSYDMDFNSSSRFNGSGQSSNYSNYPDVDPQNDQWWLRIIFCILMAFLSVFGTIGNTFVITSILTVRELRKLRNVFILNLGVSDLMITAISMPFNIAGAVTKASYWDGKDALCRFVSEICIPGCSSSLFSMAAIAFERYLCICHIALHQKIFTLSNCILMVAILWIAASLIHLPNHIGWGEVYFDQNFFLCWLDLRLWSYSFFYAMVSVLVPITFCFFAYFSIYMKIRSTTQSRKMITNRRNEMDVEKATQSAWLEEVVLVKTLFKVFIIFLLAWGPVAVLFCFNKLISPPRWINLLALMMAHGNSATNSLVYYFLNSHYTQTMMRAARSKLTRSAASQVYPLKEFSRPSRNGIINTNHEPKSTTFNQN